LSMTALCGITLWIMALAANLPVLQLFSTMGLGTMVAAISISLKDYQRRRFISFLNPWESQQGDGFQLTQSLMAIGSGNIWGTGFGMSRQKLFLPFQYTDFIFAIFAEEFGLVGCIALILMLILFATIGMLIAFKCQNATVRLVAVGTTVLLVGQSFINIGVATGALPTTGLPFPFWTYGGSSMLSSLFVVGLLIRCGREMSQVILFRPRISPELELRKKGRQLSSVK
jgi:cell division protein FtsW